jgi:hypothetical protein
MEQFSGEADCLASLAMTGIVLFAMMKVPSSSLRGTQCRSNRDGEEACFASLAMTKKGLIML